MKLCHGNKFLKETKSTKDGKRRFKCECGEVWFYTEAAGYFQQGRPPIANAKKVVVTKRVTEAEYKGIKAGDIRIELRKTGE